MSNRQIENGNSHHHFLYASEGLNTLPDTFQTKLIDSLLASVELTTHDPIDMAIIKDALHYFYQHPSSDVYHALWLEDGTPVGSLTIQQNGRVYVQHDAHADDKIATKREMLQQLVTSIFEKARLNGVDIIHQLSFQAEYMIPPLLHLSREARISVIDLSINQAGYRGAHVHESK